MSTRLHVGNIPDTIEEHELRATFSRFGTVENVAIARDTITGRHKGFAIVVMTRTSDADYAVRGLNFSQYEGRTIGVSKAKPTSGCESSNGNTTGASPNPIQSSLIFDE